VSAGGIVSAGGAASTGGVGSADGDVSAGGVVSVLNPPVLTFSEYRTGLAGVRRANAVGWRDRPRSRALPAIDPEWR
jgi:hypothetical protein